MRNDTLRRCYGLPVVLYATTNCHYLCFMKNPRDSASLFCLGRQMNGGKKNQVMETAYKECMSKPYGYLFVDCSQNQNDKYRFRNNLFPENCIVYSED